MLIMSVFHFVPRVPRVKMEHLQHLHPVDSRIGIIAGK
jgi:hypothetical protein